VQWLPSAQAHVRPLGIDCETAIITAFNATAKISHFNLGTMFLGGFIASDLTT
jgi:hypothetical protein